ncbi:MAG TPA: N-acetylglucosamine-6-phosphate deacetylase [Ktedonobacterales bacterium]
MKCTLRGAQLVDAQHDTPRGDLTIEDARILTVGTFSAPSGASHTVFDATGMIVTPGFIDVHTHGGGGCNLHTTDAREISAYARWAPQTGVTAFLIGVVGTPGALPQAQLRASVDAIATQSVEAAEPLGIHLEGPYISEARRGAHAPAWLREPNASEIEEVLAITSGNLRLITLAPELPGAAEIMRRLVQASVTVSIGHTDATYEQTLEALALGATHVTHCCNAMRPLHHREPGPIGAIVRAPQVYGELIADGVHVHPAMMDILVRILGPERTIVITDALAGAGMPDDGVFEFAGQQARVICGAARLADGTITGSILTMDQALRNILKMTHVSLQDAIAMLTINPARSIKVGARKGLLHPGYDADLLVFDDTLTLQATFCRGALTFATDAWQARAVVSDA